MSFYTPRQDQEALQAAHSNGVGLPHVLLIGDSISCGYTLAVRDRLADFFKVERPDANCGDTRHGLAKLDDWLGETHWDLIYFNWGLHDLCYRHPESPVYGHRDKVRGTLSVLPRDYRENLVMLVTRLQKRARHLIWASTTWVPAGEAGRVQGDEVRYNALAAEVMAEHGVKIHDLHSLTAAFPANLFTCPGDVHYTRDGYSRIADAVANCIRECLQPG